jgi:hypothetical protein
MSDIDIGTVYCLLFINHITTEGMELALLLRQCRTSNKNYVLWRVSVHEGFECSEFSFSVSLLLAEATSLYGLHVSSYNSAVTLLGDCTGGHPDGNEPGLRSSSPGGGGGNGAMPTRALNMLPNHADVAWLASRS